MMTSCCMQRFLPSEFGHDVDRAEPVEPGLSMYIEKRRVRRSIEESGIPYTYICCNSIASWPYYDNTHPSEVLPPLDHFQIYGDGYVKGTESLTSNINYNIIHTSNTLFLNIHKKMINFLFLYYSLTIKVREQKFLYFILFFKKILSLMNSLLIIY